MSSIRIPPDLTTLFDITTFGAVADGQTDCSQAFRDAAAACARKGGGTIHVPAGHFVTGPIVLESRMTLHLDNGALLSFLSGQEAYPIVESYWEGRRCLTHQAMISAESAEDVAIIGQGVLDGCGKVWWDRHRQGRLAYPRPRLIGLHHCRNLLIEGIRIINSPSWTINPVYCENVAIHRVTIVNPADSPNTDGINPDSCRHVRISDCHVDVGDDCITLKSGIEGREPQLPCENIVITNCIMVHGHGGVVIGSEMSGGVRNVAITNCIFQDTDRGIRIKTRRRRGGVVENIRVSNIIMERVLCPLVINAYYWLRSFGTESWLWDDKPLPVDAGTPRIRNIRLSQITARAVRSAAGFIIGLPEMPLEDISLSDVDIEMAEEAAPAPPAMVFNLAPMSRAGFQSRFVERLELDRVRIRNCTGPAFNLTD